MGKVDGLVVAITGAASGIGEATARLMVAEGAAVVLGDIQTETGRELAQGLGAAASFLSCDVTDESDIAGLVDSAVATHGRLDCMFNNAGIVGALGPIDQIPAEEYELTMAVLLRSVFFGMKHAARVMKPRRSGSIISTSSVAGVHGGLGPHVYTAAKTAIVGLTQNVAAELGPWRIRANAIAPGKLVTPMNVSMLVGDHTAIDRAKELSVTRTPLPGRIGEAEDVARAAVFLASGDAGFISGHTLVVDGGLTTGSIENLAPDDVPSQFRAGQPLVREAGRRGLGRLRPEG